MTRQVYDALPLPFLVLCLFSSKFTDLSSTTCRLPDSLLFRHKKYPRNAQPYLTAYTSLRDQHKPVRRDSRPLSDTTTKGSPSSS